MAKGKRMKAWKTNEPLKLKKLRAEVYLRQHKKSVWILIAVVFLVLMCMNYTMIVSTVNVVNNMDSTKVSVLGTLFGALIGGTMSLFGSVWVNSKQQKAAQTIKRKNLIYSPLYDELMKKQEEIFLSKRYPSRVEFAKEAVKYTPWPCYSAWERIKSDTRYLEVPENLKDQMESLECAIQNYAAARQLLSKQGENIVNEVLRANGKTSCGNSAAIGEAILGDVLGGADKNNHKYLFLRENDQTEPYASKMASEVFEKIAQSSERRELETKYTDWKTVQKQTIDFLGLLIKQVLVKYEE